MDKKYIFIILLLLTVGFASVNTYLDLNGKVDVGMLESDLDVVFKEVLVNKENNENAFIIEEGKSFIYAADELENINETSELDYVVMNQSHQYDVEVRVSCVTDYESYINYEGTFDNNNFPIEKGIIIEAGEIKRGNIITELIKENNTSESLVLKCTLSYIPVSRDTVVKDEEYIVSFNTGYEESVGDIKVKYYEEYGKLPELTRSNYTFLGWYTEDDIKVESNSLVKIKGDHTLKAKWTFVCPYNVGQVWTFDYTGSEQTFTVPCDGNYKLETWGASGYQGEFVLANSFGRGAYVAGDLSLNRNKILYVFVGGMAETPSAFGYNGGGIGEAPGGGATDIRLVDGIWNNFDSLKSRIIVAAGGGGGAYINWISAVYSRGDGGALNGIDSKMYYTFGNTTEYSGYGASQTSGGKSGVLAPDYLKYGDLSHISGQFGIGGYGFLSGSNFYPSSGGGGGYYGGGHGIHPGNSWTGGGGGSSFISGYSGCNAIAESSTASNIIHTGQPNHYSGYIFTNATMIAGNAAMPNYSGTGTMTGNTGNGYAKITYLG